ncbi:MAG: MFS transporter [Alistipes sp.]
MQIQTGKGTLPLLSLIAIWSISAISSLPGLAISPILGDLNRLFPTATDLEIQMLTSLPSLLIIPFVLLSGKLSVQFGKIKLLQIGLTIFFLSGVACLFAENMLLLIIISCILGVGAGIVIPLSTGLIVDYFTGDRRVKQLGYSSAINNLTLVLATTLTGYLAGIEWHLPFLVYTLPVISLALSVFLKNQPALPEPMESDQFKQKTIDIRKLMQLMALYFFITFAVLVVPFYIAFLVDVYHFHATFSGVLIALFFLAIMLPGLLLSRLIHTLRGNINWMALLMIGIGLLGLGIFKNHLMMIFGCLLVGGGYGVMQPLIYDKAAIIAPPRSATLALSFVMAVNYLAIMVCPFIITLFRDMAQTQSDRFPFFFNAILTLLVATVAFSRRTNFALGLDASYYK